MRIFRENSYNYNINIFLIMNSVLIIYLLEMKKLIQIHSYKDNILQHNGIRNT